MSRVGSAAWIAALGTLVCGNIESISSTSSVLSSLNARLNQGLATAKIANSEQRIKRALKWQSTGYPLETHKCGLMMPALIKVMGVPRKELARFLE